MVNKAEPRLTRSGVVDTDNPSNEGIRCGGMVGGREGGRAVPSGLFFGHRLCRGSPLGPTHPPSRPPSLPAHPPHPPTRRSDIRTSYGMFFDRYEDDMIKSIEEKLSEWTLIPPGHGEGLQVLAWGGGGRGRGGGERRERVGGRRAPGRAARRAAGGAAPPPELWDGW